MDAKRVDGEGQGAPLPNAVAAHRESTIKWIEGGIALKKYAISRGLDISEATLSALNQAESALLGDRFERLPVKIGTEFDLALKDLTALTFPATVDTVTASDTAETKKPINRFKIALPITAGVALIIAIVSFSRLLPSIPPSNASLSILGASLGLLGAAVYQLFNLTGILSEKAFNVGDVYANLTRLAIGPIMGWMFYFAFQESVRNALTKSAASSGGGSSALYLFIAFLAGFSTKLVVGIITQMIRALELVLGIGGKGNQLLLRGRAQSKGKDSGTGDS